MTGVEQAREASLLRPQGLLILLVLVVTANTAVGATL
jgi:hypothetical protein